MSRVSSGDALRLVRPQELDRAHVVQPVGELDEDHAAGRATSTAASCGSSRPARPRVAVEVEARQLGDALDQAGDLACRIASRRPRSSPTVSSTTSWQQARRTRSACRARASSRSRRIRHTAIGVRDVAARPDSRRCSPWARGGEVEAGRDAVAVHLAARAHRAPRAARPAAPDAGPRLPPRRSSRAARP